MSEIRIERATRFMLYHLDDLLREGIAEGGGFYPAPQYPHTYHVALNLIQANMVYVAVEYVDDKPTTVVGCLMLDAKKWAWAPDSTILESVHFYVRKQFRTRTIEGRSIAVALLDAGRALSAHVGYPLLVQVITPMDADPKTAFVERSGFENVGGNLMFVPKQNETAQAA